jgi:hypothetical protein
VAIAGTFVRNHRAWFTAGAVSFCLLGIIGYVGGRFLAAADDRFLPLVFLATYVLLAGLTLIGVLFVAFSAATRRPLIPRALAAIGVLFGTLIVLFPYSRAVAYPQAVLATIAIVLVAVGWKDLSDPRVWSGTPPDGSDAS